MTVPQPGIFALGTRYHHHLQFDVVGDDAAACRVLAAVREAATTVAGTNVVIGFGPSMWARVAPDEVPGGLADFTPVEGADGYRMPAAQHDLWIWFHGGSVDSLFDAARTAVRALADVADLAAEQQAFTYRASQDLTGFEDGTENPPIDEAAAVASVPDGEPGAGGSVALVQRWVHDLDAVDDLAPDAREQLIGRTLDSSEEIDDDERSARSHISRVVIEDESGEELEMFRRSAAFGDVGENGLVFVGFAADVTRMRRMLDRMAGAGDGLRDHLTDFSTPVDGAWYYAPPTDLLRTVCAL